MLTTVENLSGTRRQDERLRSNSGSHVASSPLVTSSGRKLTPAGPSTGSSACPHLGFEVMRTISVRPQTPPATCQTINSPSRSHFPSLFGLSPPRHATTHRPYLVFPFATCQCGAQRPPFLSPRNLFFLLSLCLSLPCLSLSLGDSVSVFCWCVWTRLGWRRIGGREKVEPGRCGG